MIVALCGEQGPPPFPGGKGYLCTREAWHVADVHWAVSTRTGRVMDSWPALDAEALRGDLREPEP